MARLVREALTPTDRTLTVFGGYELGPGGTRALTSRTGPAMAALKRAHRGWRRGATTAGALADALLAVCAAADDGAMWHRELGARAYVDASLQARVCRTLLESIASDAVLRTAEALSGERPDARPLLLTLGELRLEAGDLDGAIDAARRALRVQAICPAGENLLIRASAAKRLTDQEPCGGELAEIELEGRFCPAPFQYLSTGLNGQAFVCSCPAWVPYPVGNVYDAAGPDDLWNSTAAREVRRSVLDGDFSYCMRTQCSFMLANKLPRTDEITDPNLRHLIDAHETYVEAAPRVVELNHDPTCNLACPSCRTEIIAAPPSERGRLQRAADDVLLPLLREVNGIVYVSGGGEALSSPHFRSVLRRLNRHEYPDVGVYLITNGLLLTPRRWSSLPQLSEMLHTVAVSVDAARPGTYEQLRRPGRWNVLRRNLEYLGELRRAGEIPRFQLNFVVQAGNFREMLEFADLADEVGADRLWYQRLVNYGAYEAAEFLRIDIANPSHPDHDELLVMLRHPRLRCPEVNLNMLLGLLPEFVESDEPLEMLL